MNFFKKRAKNFSVISRDNIQTKEADGAYINFLGFYKKLPQAWYLNAVHIYPHFSSESKSVSLSHCTKSGSSQSPFTSEILEDSPLSCPFYLLSTSALPGLWLPSWLAPTPTSFAGMSADWSSHLFLMRTCDCIYSLPRKSQIISPSSQGWFNHIHKTLLAV